jgi:hypothetical protein
MSEQPDFSKGIKKGLGFRDSVSSMLDSGRDNLRGGMDFVSRYWPEMALTTAVGVLGATFLLGESILTDPE